MKAASDETDDRPLWAWRKGAAPLLAAVAAPALRSSGEAGGAIATPFAESRPLHAARAGDPTASGSPDLTVVGWSVVGVLAAAFTAAGLRRRLLR